MVKPRNWAQRTGILPMTNTQRANEANAAKDEANAKIFNSVAANAASNTPNSKTTTTQPLPNKKIDFEGLNVKITQPDGTSQTMTRAEYKNYENSLKTGASSAGYNKNQPAFKQAQQADMVNSEAYKTQQAVSGLGLTQDEIIAAQNQATETPINKSQALTAGIANVLPSTVGGAVGGAAVGAIGGVGVGAIPGAVVGGIGGFLTGLFNGIKGNIAKQQADEIGQANKILSVGRTNMRQLAVLAAKDPGNAEQYVEAYDRQLAQIYTAQRKLKLEVSGDLNSFMEDGGEDLKAFDLFLQPMGMADIYKQKLQMALLTGVPPEFTAEDLASLEG